MTSQIQDSDSLPMRRAYVQGAREAGKHWAIKAAVFIIVAAIWCYFTHTPGEHLFHWLNGGWFGSFIPRWIPFLIVWVVW